ncbi:MAG: SufD family Fe-S cluster assembly protein [Candidatus Kerfeldbacteria bacterium]|nr:SufD family Fe-S cluster assembly protein [Candidatus Kerfeldbacteria bacterium]
MSRIDRPHISIPTTNRALYPKADPLQRLPEALERRVRGSLRPKRVLVKKSGIISLDIQVEQFHNVQYHIAAGITVTFVLIGAIPVINSGLHLVTCQLSRNSRVTVIQALSGGARVDTHLRFELQGSGAVANYRGVLFGQARSQHALHLIMHHQAPHTSGDILLKGVYTEQSKGVITGLIKIDRRAQDTDSYFGDDVLLFDQGMTASEPMLEIEADNVRASHGSTTGRVNSDQLFYLQSRGLSYQQARYMIIQGFFQPVLANAPEAQQAQLSSFIKAL